MSVKMKVKNLSTGNWESVPALKGDDGGTWTSASAIPLVDSSNLFPIKNVEEAFKKVGTDLAQISYSGKLTTFMCQSIQYTSKIDSKGTLFVTGSPRMKNVIFPVEYQEITFTHIVNDDWIVIGGDNTIFTAMSIGVNNIWLSDCSDGGIIGVQDKTIVVADKPNLGDRINLKWVGNSLIAKKNKNDGNGYVDWFNFDITLHSTIKNCTPKRFGVMNTTYVTTDAAIMRDVDFSALGTTSLTDRVIDLERKVPSLKWENKSWNAVGDSITQQAKWTSDVSKDTGLIFVNRGIGGSTIAINNTQLQNQSVVERVLGLNGNTAYADADLWTVFSAVNDWTNLTPLGSMSSTISDTTTYYGALKAICENIITRPNHPILVLFTPLPSYKQGANTNGTTMLQYCQAIKDVGAYYSLPVLDLYSISGFNTLNFAYYTQDGLHPNDIGAKLFAPRISSFINSL